jgi:hypothetical protein
MFWLLIFPDSLQCIISAHFTNSNAGWTVLLGGFWWNESKTWLFAAARSSQLRFCLQGLGQVYFTVMWDCLQRSWPLKWLFADANAILFQILFVKDVESVHTILECLWCLWMRSGDLGERVAQHNLKICSIFSVILALYRDRWIESYPSAILALWKDLLKELSCTLHWISPMCSPL